MNAEQIRLERNKMRKNVPVSVVALLCGIALFGLSSIHPFETSEECRVEIVVR